MSELVPCPLCGGTEGYVIQKSSHFKWWNVNCYACGDQVTECRADLSGDICERHPYADTAWNEAGAYAEGLRVRVCELREALDEFVNHSLWIPARHDQCGKGIALNDLIDKARAAIAKATEG